MPELTEQEGHIPYYFPAREAFGNLQDGEYSGKIRCGLDSGNVTIVVEEDTVTECEIIWLLVSPQVYEDYNPLHGEPISGFPEPVLFQPRYYRLSCYRFPD